MSEQGARMDVARWVSPNFGERRGKARPELIVLHYTAMEGAEAACARLCDPQAEVSAHYVISEQGALWRLVPEEARAWHAGAGAWGGREDVNSRSIGIELSNLGNHPFPEPQMRTLEALLGDIMERWSLPPEAVIGHSDMAPGRKIDPGARFDWLRLARLGLAVWPEARPDLDVCCDAEAFERNARCFGYPQTDLATLVEVIRLRFRPWATGALAVEDCRVMADLAQRYPVDRGGREA